MAVRADIDHIVVDGALSPRSLPGERRSRHLSGDGKAVVDSRLDFRALFVIVPGHQLQEGQLIAGVVIAVDLAVGLEPSLAALLADHAIEAPRRQSIVEAFVAGSPGRERGSLGAGVVELGEVIHSVVLRSGVHPGVTAAREGMGETSGVFENPGHVRAGGGLDRVPIQGEVQIEVELCNHGLAV